MSNNIDNLLNYMSDEELRILAGETDTQSTVNIYDSTINIYNTPQKRNSATPPTDYNDNLCYDCGKAYNDCECVSDDNKAGFASWYMYPVYLMPLIGGIQLVQGIWKIGSKIFTVNRDNTISLPQNLANKMDNEIIDTEIIEEPLTDAEIEQQIYLTKKAKGQLENEELNEYTKLFRLERGIA